MPCKASALIAAISAANSSGGARINLAPGCTYHLTAANNTEGNPMESLKTGIAMVYNQLKNALTEAGLEEIDAAGQTFDPNLHEAVSQEDSTDLPEGHVIRQLRKGYRLRERLIRPASVVVARKPAA